MRTHDTTPTAPGGEPTGHDVDAPDAHGRPALLTLNAGSSSIKFALYEDEASKPMLVGQIENLGREPVMRVRRGEVELHDAFDGASGHAPPADHAQALAWLVAWLDRHSTGHRVVAVGHRVVHGGLHHHEPIVVDDAAVERLRTLCPLAPLHQPHNLAGIDAARAAFGAVPQVACFDTAFHRAQPFVADCFALPRELYQEGVRRYGFHGLSYESITHHLRRSFPLHAAGRVIVAHLGNGASMCAMREGRSIASTMGFSALDGLPMGTRCGQVDPGVVLYLMEHKGLDAAAITDVLYRRSGLLGLSGGLSNDMRTLEASEAPEAGEAIDHFVFRIRREMGGLAASLEGLDAVVFTGGIGENSVLVRSRVLSGMEWLGIEIDEARNRAGESIVSSPRSRVLALVLRSDEEGVIARHTARLAGIDGRRTVQREAAHSAAWIGP